VRRVSIDDVYVTFEDMTPDTNASGPNSANYIFSTDSAGMRLDPADVAGMSSWVSQTIPYSFGGRSWEARFAASNRFVSTRMSITPHIVLAVFALMFVMAIAGSCCLYVYVWESVCVSWCMRARACVCVSECVCVCELLTVNRHS
jgi:hypothetical protein